MTNKDLCKRTEAYHKLRNILEEQEGKANKSYTCEGVVHIGIGHNCEGNIISERVIDMIFHDDISLTIDSLQKTFGAFYQSIPPYLQLPLIIIMFVLGYHRFRTFKRMIKAIKKDDWLKAKAELIDSAWHEKYPKRVEAIAALFDIDTDEA